MTKILVEVENIQPTSPETPNNFILKLKEKDGTRNLKIIIGLYDSQIIAFELQKLKSARPLAHDLYKTILDKFDIELKYTEITSMDSDEGVFYANINLNDKILDCRPSDGIIMALKFNAPIYVNDNLFKLVGDEGFNTSFAQSTLTTDILIKQKEAQLLEASEKEDYDLADKIKKEIEKLKKRQSGI
jgi:bifunctional DNase/RNase